MDSPRWSDSGRRVVGWERHLLEGLLVGTRALLWLLCQAGRSADVGERWCW